VAGDWRGDLTVGSNALGDGIGALTLQGDLGADMIVQGDVGKMKVVGGQVTDNGVPGDPRIEVTGNVQYMSFTGFTGGEPVVGDDILIGGRADYVLVKDGDVNGDFEAGSIGQMLLYTPSGITQSVTSHGNLDVLRVFRGPIAAPVNVYHHAGTIEAKAGVADASDIAVGESGAPGAGLDRILVSGGELRGDITVLYGTLNQIKVTGDMTDCDVNVAGDLLEAYVSGNYADSNILATHLSRVTVRGGVSGPGEVHAAEGSFLFGAAAVTYTVPPEVFLNGIHAYVG
jgi:hypothetical protein